jgi:hypothetical protein
LKEFAPAPESIKPNIEWFSDYQKEVGLKTGSIRYNEKTNEYINLGTNKLIPHLFKHEKYSIHYRNLKLLVKLGVKISTVHSIDNNTYRRKLARNDFEKYFYKLVNNSVFLVKQWKGKKK